jgi:3-dehydroquinate synthetase
MVLETRLAEALGMANVGLADEIAAVLRRFSLPVDIPPGLDRQTILEAMQVDKKKYMGELRFALPVKIGEVTPGIPISGKNLERLKKNLEAGE